MAREKGFVSVAYLQQRAADKRGRPARTAPLALPDTGDAHDALSACAQAWCDALAAKGLAPKTIEERRCSLRLFIEWAKERDVTRAGEITRPVLEAYQRAVSRHVQPSGKGKGARLGWNRQRSRLSCLKNWFQWLTRRDLILHNPASEIELPRPEKRLPATTLNPDELARFLSVHDTADPLGLRDRAICELFYSTGIRRAELVRLGLTDINPERGTLTVRQGKGRKDRVVPLGARAAAWLARYLDEVRPRLLLDNRQQTLFLTGYGEPFHPNAISYKVTCWMRAAGLDKRGSCHLLRHTCATHMLDGGADIRHIQKLLGHENLDTTAIYTEVSIKQLIEVHARCHPAGRIDTTTADTGTAAENTASPAQPDAATCPPCSPSPNTPSP